MKNELRSILHKYNIFTRKIVYKNTARIYDDRIVLKPVVNSKIPDIYKYLRSRSFDYFPNPIEVFREYEVYPFIKDVNEPVGQRAQDIMHLVSLLHSKTTFYSEIDIDKIKEIYETVMNKVNYLLDYYNMLIDDIEKEIYMSPSSYLIARNINIIFDSIYYVRENIEKWYKLEENSKTIRNVNIHGNINLDHYIKDDKPYLISWNNSRIDNPIYDLLTFYKNNYLDIDFYDLLKYYEKNYPLKQDERLLLFVYMAIPPIIKWENNEYKMCIKINKVIDYLYKTNNLIKNYQKNDGSFC